jgi:uncharacterized protein (DUF2126 family)/transglutaminase-like putative cysteine protease
MPIHVSLHHVTHYRYDKEIALGPHTVRLRPAPHSRSKVLAYSLRITPAEHFLNWQQDPQSNYLARLVFPEKTKDFRVEVDLVVEMTVFNPFDFFLEADAEHVPIRYDASLDHELEPFRKRLPRSPRLSSYVEEIAGEIHKKNLLARLKQEEESKKMAASGKSADAEPEKVGYRTIDFLVDLNARLNRDISYCIRMEPGVQTPEETLEKASGSCRDSAWLMCQILRSLGMASRFVSGYLIQLKADQKSLDGPSGPEQDFTDLHAWCEVFLPGAGWVGLDPTSGLFASEGHIPLAATPDPSSAAPISGALEPCETEFSFDMSVERVRETPRVTLPYTDEQWTAIDSLGEAIDRELRAHDVRLTMGGEPTFVSIDDMDGDEWNTAAMGPTKRLLAGQLVKRLRERFAPGGFLHYGQGKWYPGEPLPRWALGCWWRKDGEPIWRDDQWIANEEKNYHHGEEEAQKFAILLAHVLGVDTGHLIPAYEDVYYYLWREKRLPANVDPLKNNLADPLERARVARIFHNGLGTCIGYALPLQGSFEEGKVSWRTGRWFLRDEHMFLVPGDSPMGYRLPLDSLPWVKEEEFPFFVPEDPMRDARPLPPRPKTQQMALQQIAQSIPFTQTSFSLESDTKGTANTLTEWSKKISASLAATHPSQTTSEPAANQTADREPEEGESAPWIVRRAMCFEPRDGRLHLFLPPLQTVEEFLELAHAIEEVAKALEIPVVIEGEAPPFDPRLQNFKITPDPGVIEVNLQPAASWKDLAANTNTLYEEARQCRLGTEKFLLDGRHAGTGGGNHIVLGGETPSDSPFLRRPDVLRSILGFWHNHPSLSYLFSGLFIGPTSQHPRVDEARDDALYELEIAFSQIPDHGQVPPWMVDRVFRHLLVDLTGNTHRAEFCIDKMFSPDSSTGRLGLVELRSFEMPPHERMSLAQQLLIRAAVARFWKEPSHLPLVRWGTELHDRFMLPHFVWQDFCEVIDDLQHHGYALKPEWFAPHAEFRFPLIGSFAQHGIEVELRTALEPWHVLGEEATGGGTARYVDSSLERMQVKVTGWTDQRYAVTCNGRRLPLQPSGIAGEYVAGVRYRAWQPPSCLQPMIGVHAPLTFDLIDTWTQRSMGGCVYHVTHQGGLSHERFPVNAAEAESRRMARYFSFGHTPGRMESAAEQRNPVFPFTLDLRTECERNKIAHPH